MLNTNKLRPFWKEHEPGTHILTLYDVQIASIQPDDNNKPCVYWYDSDFQGLFKGTSEYEFSTVDECKNKVENLFTGWISMVLGVLSNVS